MGHEKMKSFGVMGVAEEGGLVLCSSESVDRFEVD